MNKQYNFTITGGFPLDQGVLNDLQSGILQNETALANLLGPLAIISGCTVAGGSAANGVVAINGQILPFVGGVVGVKVIIVETDTAITYQNGATPPSLITRYATFGDDGVQNNPWANFVTNTAAGIIARMVAVENYWQTGDVKQIDVTEAYIAANFDGTGLGKNLRLGWAICNGANGTVNRLGKVAVQRDPAQTEFAAMGTAGGEKVHLLTNAETPVPAGLPPGLDGPHPKPADGGGAAEYYVTGPLSAGSPAGSAHNNLQPYITTLYIQKL